MIWNGAFVLFDRRIDAFRLGNFDLDGSEIASVFFRTISGTTLRVISGTTSGSLSGSLS